MARLPRKMARVLRPLSEIMMAVGAGDFERVWRGRSLGGLDGRSFLMSACELG